MEGLRIRIRIKIRIKIKIKMKMKERLGVEHGRLGPLRPAPPIQVCRSAKE
jgi:hypothetical protein